MHPEGASHLPPSDGTGGLGMEMFPSSAVAQSHLPGASALGALQQPPPSAHIHHHRSASFLPHQDRPNTDMMSTAPTLTSTNTATNSAMVVDEPAVPPPVAKTDMPAPPVKDNAEVKDEKKEVTDTNDGVRKVR